MKLEALTYANRKPLQMSSDRVYAAVIVVHIFIMDKHLLSDLPADYIFTIHIKQITHAMLQLLAS